MSNSVKTDILAALIERLLFLFTRYAAKAKCKFLTIALIITPNAGGTEPVLAHLIIIQMQ